MLTSKMVVLKEAVKLPDGTIEHGWGVGFDDHNIILYKLGFVTKEKSKNLGQPSHVPEGYYPNLSSLLRGMMSKQVIIEGEGITSIEELDKKLDEFCSKVWYAVNDDVNKLKTSR